MHSALFWSRIARAEPPEAPASAPSTQPEPHKEESLPLLPPQSNEPWTPPPRVPAPGSVGAASRPPPMIYALPETHEPHAPEYALFTSARLGFLGYGLSFYSNERGDPETTGNFVGNGVAGEINVGARLARRFIPHVFWEHGWLGQGHRFDGTNARSSSEYYGIGFRYIGGNVDSVGIVTDIAAGRRVIRVTNDTQQYEMSGLEFFRLGLGAEIRLSTLMSITPLLSISGGSLNDTEGTIDFACAPNCSDGLQKPTYSNGQVIKSSLGYAAINFSASMSFDWFGK